MEKDENGKTIIELINELGTNEKVIEEALNNFQGKKVTINTLMYSSVNSTIGIDKLDWTYLAGLNQQNYIYISEHPFEAMTGTNLILDIDNIDEVEYSKDTLRVWFKDGFRLYVNNDKE